MKRILLPALLAVSSFVFGSTTSNEAQAAGFLGDPDINDIWLCVYRRHGIVLHTKGFFHERSCPDYVSPDTRATPYPNGHNHLLEAPDGNLLFLVAAPDDIDCTISVFGSWG